MRKITTGETTHDVTVVILIRARDATLERILQDGKGSVDALAIRLEDCVTGSAEENLIRLNQRVEEGYEYLYLRRTDGRAMYPVKPEHLSVAEEIANEVGEDPRQWSYFHNRPV